MKTALLASMLCWLLSLPVRTDQSNLVLVVDGVTYSNVTFTSVSPTTVSIIHQTGAVIIPLDKLPPELQKQFNYDPKKAAAYRLAPGPAASDQGPPGRETIARKAHLSAMGVSRTGAAAFNVEESPFAAYDSKIFKTVQSRWENLINHFGRYDQVGTVTMHFYLMADGTLKKDPAGNTVMEITNNSGGRIMALLCEKAIVESALFDPFPDNLRALAGKEPREAMFTFYY